MPRQLHDSSSVREVFARRMREVRQRKDWTQQDLAQRLGRLGAHMNRSSLAKIETGRRSVSLEEAFAIAAALGVSPGTLFFPIQARAEVRVAGRLRVKASKARSWLSNEAPLEAADWTAFVEVAEEETRALRALRKDVRLLLRDLRRLEEQRT